MNWVAIGANGCAQYLQPCNCVRSTTHGAVLTLEKLHAQLLPINMIAIALGLQLSVRH